MFKPDNYNSLSPYFIVKGASQYAKFLQDLFEAKELRKYENPDGSIMHMELMIDDTVIMLGDASDKFPANSLILHLYVKDSEAVYQKAINMGCQSLQEPKKLDGDPDKRATFLDKAGNMWSVGTQVE